MRRLTGCLFLELLTVALLIVTGLLLGWSRLTW
jgi:hypothetical protein